MLIYIVLHLHIVTMLIDCQLLTMHDYTKCMYICVCKQMLLHTHACQSLTVCVFMSMQYVCMCMQQHLYVSQHLQNFTILSNFCLGHTVLENRIKVIIL